MKIAPLLAGLLMVGTLFLTGCGDNEQQVSFNTVQKGHVPPPQLDGPAATVTVLRDQADWIAFWNILYTNYSEKPPLPSVDFNTSAVIAVVDAPRSSGGYSITINSIKPTSSGVTVYSEVVNQGCYGGATLAFTQPFHIVTVPAFSGDATLQLSESFAECDQ